MCSDVMHQRHRQVYIYAYTPAHEVVSTVYHIHFKCVLYSPGECFTSTIITGPLVEVVIEQHSFRLR